MSADPWRAADILRAVEGDADGGAPASGALAVEDDPVEALVALALCDVLQLEQAPPQATFAELGGDSLAAIEIFARVARWLHVRLPPSALAPTTTCAELAAVVRARRAAGQAPAPAPAPPAGSPLVTPGQAAILLAEQTASPSAVYTIACALRLRGLLDDERLERAYRQVVQRHEALRTTYALGERGFEARLEPTARCRLERHAARDAPAALQLARRLAAEPLSPDRAPLLHLHAIVAGDDEHLLCVRVHHVACDGWSLRIVLRELAAVYAGARLSEAAAHEQFRAFAAAERAHLRSEAGSAEVSAWETALAGVPAAGSLTRGEACDGATGRFDGGTVALELPIDGASELRAICARHGATPFIAVLTALSAALSRRSGATDFVIGAPVANRGDPAHASIVGYLSTTAPLRIDASGDPSLRELLGRVRGASLAASERQRVPLPAIAEACAARASGRRRPLFDVACAIVDLTPAPFAGLETTAVPLHTGTAKFPLMLYLERHGERLLGHLEYALDRLEAGDVEGIASDLRAALQQLATDADRRCSQLEPAS